VELNFSDAAPLMCVSMTTFNALRHSGANPGDTVAIVGLGGLGHLAVQFASKMGFRTVVVAREKDRPLNLRAPVWDWRLADRSSNPMAAACGPQPALGAHSGPTME
jgi:D-arabinose 1-dehydrogenase-like Zn-dependent alcohol dehydrogenase